MESTQLKRDELQKGKIYNFCHKSSGYEREGTFNGFCFDGGIYCYAITVTTLEGYKDAYLPVSTFNAYTI